MTYSEIHYPGDRWFDLEGDDLYATFNNGPHLCVNVPDGSFTITAKTSEGKRITFAFAPYKKDGPAGCVDVVFHDAGRTVNNYEKDIPVFGSINFGMGKTLNREDNNTIVSIILDEGEAS